MTTVDQAVITSLVEQLRALRIEYDNFTRKGLPVSAVTDPDGVTYRRSLQEKAKDIRSIKDFAVRGDGATSDSPLFARAVRTAADEGVPLRIPAGTYDLRDMDPTDVPPTFLFGDHAEETTLLGHTDQTFLRPTGDFIARGITLDGWNRAIEPLPSAGHRIFALENMVIQNGGDGVYTSAFDEDITLDYLRMSNTLFKGNTGFNFVHQARVAAGLIIANEFDGGTGRATQIGRNFSTAAKVPSTPQEVAFSMEAFKRVLHIGNVVHGLRSDEDNSIIAMIAYGQNMVMALNFFYDIISTADTKENDAIYTKAQHSLIIGNILRDIYHTSGTGGDFWINSKGAPRLATPYTIPGYNNIIALNQLSMRGRGKTGIRLQNESILCALNMVNDPVLYAVLLSSGVSEQDADAPGNEGFNGVSIVHNDIRGTRRVGTYAVNATTIGSNLTIDGNTIRDFETGVRVTASSGTPTAHIIARNAISGCVRAAVEADYAVRMRDLQINDNSINDIWRTDGQNSFAIIVAPTAPITLVEVRRNNIQSVQSSTATATAIFISGSQFTYLYEEDNIIDLVNHPYAPYLIAVRNGVTSISMDTNGSGYAPTGDDPIVITFTGGSGTGAAATAVVDVGTGEITALIITNPGSGYTSAPTITINGGNGTLGTDATATAHLPADPTIIDSVIVNDGGKRFTSPPLVIFTGGGGNNGAAAIAIVNAGVITAITVISGGSGYVGTPTITITPVSGGSGATATATMSGGAVASIAVGGGGGSGYTLPPLISFSAGTQATAVLSTSIESIKIVDAGSDYTSQPTVSFSGGGGSGAAATAYITDGRLLSISLDNPGTGYTSAPTVSLTGGGGTGASLEAIMASSIESITMDNQGSGYTSTPTVTTYAGYNGSGSGYAVRINAATESSRIDAARSTRAKTKNLQMDVTPTNRKGEWHVAGTPNKNPASIAAGGVETTTVTALGVRNDQHVIKGIGFFPTVPPASPAYTDFNFQATIIGDDTIQVWIYNRGAGSVNLSTGTWYFIIGTKET